MFFLFLLQGSVWMHSRFDLLWLTLYDCDMYYYRTCIIIVMTIRIGDVCNTPNSSYYSVSTMRSPLLYWYLYIMSRISLIFFCPWVILRLFRFWYCDGIILFHSSHDTTLYFCMICLFIQFPSDISLLYLMLCLCYICSLSFVSSAAFSFLCGR